MMNSCCIKDEGGPLGVGIQVLIPNYLSLSCLRDMGVSRQEKWQFMLHVRTMEMSKTESPLMCREVKTDVKTKSTPLSWDKPRSYLITDLGGVRHIGGMNLVQALIRNLGTSRSNVKGETQVVDTIESESTNVEHWGRTTRSSVETFESWWSEGVVQFSFINRSTRKLGGTCE